MTQNSTKSTQPSEGTKSAIPQQQGPAGGASRHAGGIDPTLLAHASANLQNQQFLAPHYVGSHLQGTYLVGFQSPYLFFREFGMEKTTGTAVNYWSHFLQPNRVPSSGTELLDGTCSTVEEALQVSSSVHGDLCSNN